jgi:hypothetical protein
MHTYITICLASSHIFKAGSSYTCAIAMTKRRRGFEGPALTTTRGSIAVDMAVRFKEA